MSLLPDLLRRLAQAAHSRDARTVKTTLASLSRHRGWDGDVAAFMKRMPSRDAAFVGRATKESAPNFTGGTDYAGPVFSGRRDTFPRTAEHMKVATGGYGTWSAGYLCNVGAGSIPSEFGTPASLTPASSPLYELRGPLAGSWAVGLDSNADAFEFGNVYNVTGTDDFAFAWIGYSAATPNNILMGKYDGGGPNGYYLTFDGLGNIYWRVVAAGVTTDAIVALPIAAYYLGICVIDRSTGKQRIAVRTLAGATTVSTETAITAATTTNAQPLTIGASPWLTGTTDARFAAIWLAHGSGACTGMSANLSSIASSLVSWITS